MTQWLMHWPQAMANIDDKPGPRHPGPNGEPGEGEYIMDDSVTFNQTWADMEKMLETGKVKAIGVSNFSVKKYVLRRCSSLSTHDHDYLMSDVD